MKTVAVIQARMGSTRLPGKVLRLVAGHPLLWHQAHRLRKCARVDEICIATSTSTSDDPVAAFGEALGLTVVRGSEDDVLSRFVLAAEATQADLILRVNGDAPLIDPMLLDELVALMVREDADFVMLPEGTPCIHDGVDPLSRRALDKLAAEAGDDPMAREHVTAYFKAHPDFVKIALLDLEEGLRHEGARVSVDTPADLAFIEMLYDRSGAAAGDLDLRDVVALLRREPHLQEVNRHVIQKRPGAANRTALLRCDGGGPLGLGHVMRSLSLATALRDIHGFGVSFAMCGDDAAVALVEAEKFPVERLAGAAEDVAAFADLVGAMQPDCLVIDLREGPGRAAIAALPGFKVLIDDGSERRLAADLAVYPPVPQVGDLDWSGFGGERLCGWDWVLMGREITAAGDPETASGVLVSMGGTDPCHLTPRVARALTPLLDEVRITLVVGPGFDAALRADIAKLDPRFERAEAPADLPGLAASHALAVLSFGVTAYELAAAGVPSVYLALTADHARSASAFDGAGMGISLGVHDAVRDRDLQNCVRQLHGQCDVRAAMAARGRGLVDGGGARRLAALIGERLEARPVRRAAG